MIELILILIFLFVTIFCLIFGIIISYHFKRFTLVESPETKKFLALLGMGFLFFFILNLIFLILTI